MQNDIKKLTDEIADLQNQYDFIVRQTESLINKNNEGSIKDFNEVLSILLQRRDYLSMEIGKKKQMLSSGSSMKEVIDDEQRRKNIISMLEELGMVESSIPWNFWMRNEISFRCISEM